MKDRRTTSLLIAFLLLVFVMSACNGADDHEIEGSETEVTWQEQYDLGVRYLSEGNYEEAIIAFTAAIEIDPKWAPAYVGRGDAYVKCGETAENLTAAKVDYEKAIELDEASAEAYLGLADVYIRQRSYEIALEILREGLEKTRDQSISSKLGELEETIQTQSPLEDKEPNATVSFSGTGHNMSLSLTYSDLPEEVWMNGEDTGTSAVFGVSISDGYRTFRVHTSVDGYGKTSGLVAVPTGTQCKSALFVACIDDNPNGYIWNVISTSVVVSRGEDTLTWSFAMPEQWEFTASDIQYIGYDFYYREAPYSLGDRPSVIGQGTFQCQGKQVVYLNNGRLGDMGFLITAEDAENIR